MTVLDRFRKKDDRELQVLDTYRGSALHSARCGGCGKANHFRTVYKMMQRQGHSQSSLRGGKSVHKVQ